jgi:hypothetical protein
MIHHKIFSPTLSRNHATEIKSTLTAKLCSKESLIRGCPMVDEIVSLSLGERVGVRASFSPTELLRPGNAL